jgi:hypothetical protein
MLQQRIHKANTPVWPAAKPQAPTEHPRRPPSRDDSWFSSSFDLRGGLTVIEVMDEGSPWPQPM